jgi:CheY-like chemotaxis protein
MSIKLNQQRAKSSSPESSCGAARREPSLPVTILHIDDDPNDSELLRAATRHAGTHFDLQTVEDAERAMEYLSGAGPYSDRHAYPFPALILLDLKMPRATGLELLEWIRRNPTFANLPVVVLSGSELHEDIRRAYDRGANSYLIKPLGFEALVDMLKDVQAVWIDGPSRSRVQL